MLSIRFEEPKSPVRSGRRGSFNSRFRTHSPKSPVRMKMSSAEIFFLSVRISIVEVMIKMYGIMFWI